jgi:hypothetical protein
MLTLLIEKLPEMAARKAPIIELTTAPADQLALAQLIARAGMRERLGAFKWERDLNWITASDGRATFSANERSGGLRYRLRPLEEESGRDVTTSHSALEEISRGFLNRLGRPSGPMALEHITYLRTEAGSSEGTAVERATLDAAPLFRRTVGELSVIGPGGIAMVKIGTDESVVGGREIWRSIVRRGSPVGLRGPDEAVSLLKKRLRKIGVDGDVRVQAARLGYAELGIEQHQRFLEPCYVFILVTGEDSIPSKKIEFVPAARIGPMAQAFAAA